MGSDFRLLWREMGKIFRFDFESGVKIGIENPFLNLKPVFDRDQAEC